MITFAFVIAFGASATPSPPCPRTGDARADTRALACASASPRARRADRWNARDKLLHFTASALIQGAAHAAFRARGAEYGAASRGAAAVTLTAGIGKEVWDRWHPGHDASMRDLAWDAGGGVVAAIAIRQIDR